MFKKIRNKVNGAVISVKTAIANKPRGRICRFRREDPHCRRDRRTLACRPIRVVQQHYHAHCDQQGSGSVQLQGLNA